jgi:hypothetical protein
VRLPRDWLGPRDELVPLGRHTETREAEPAPAQLTSASALIAEPPPSAADFWGERSAAIHDAVQAPAGDAGPVKPSRRLGAPALWRGAAAAGLAIAAAAITFVAGGFGAGGSASHAGGGARLDVAAVLSSGVPQMLSRGLALLDGRAIWSPAKVGAQHGPRTGQRTGHPHSVFKRVHEAAHQQPGAATSAPANTRSAYHASVMPTSAGIGATVHTNRSTTRASLPEPRHAVRSSMAAISPTGQSGALGPITSPNG